jgi:hypothetical protein
MSAPCCCPLAFLPCSSSPTGTLHPLFPCVSVLVQHGTDPGNTAWDLAMKNGHFACVRLLVSPCRAWALCLALVGHSLCQRSADSSRALPSPHVHRLLRYTHACTCGSSGCVCGSRPCGCACACACMCMWLCMCMCMCMCMFPWLCMRLTCVLDTVCACASSGRWGCTGGG